MVIDTATAHETQTILDDICDFMNLVEAQESNQPVDWVWKIDGGNEKPLASVREIPDLVSTLREGSFLIVSNVRNKRLFTQCMSQGTWLRAECMEANGSLWSFHPEGHNEEINVAGTNAVMMSYVNSGGKIPEVPGVERRSVDY